MATNNEEAQQEAPEWLQKLETRRERVKGKLGHELGAGAPCNTCGDACPGLDLHFWRKVCRNCKCRKEHHEIQDDDLAGWMQFEILGAIRSKPAFMKIKTFAEKPVKLDWIPPNVPVDIASDYMHQLGVDMIPVAGSEAATRRKQQLEYQLPAHDLDPTLCHNLSVTEAEQLEQYVTKLKEDCAGQGNVVRIDTGSYQPQPITPKLVRDRIVQQLSGSEDLQNMLKNSAALVGGKKVTVFETPLLPDFYDKPILSDKSKFKLGAMRMNSEAVQSVVNNIPYYDSLLAKLNDRKVDFTDDKILGPIGQFFNEYVGNERFQTEVKAFVQSLPSPFKQESYIEHVKPRSPDFNSPLPIKTARIPQPQYQDTPARKLNFHNRPILSIDDVLDPATGQILVPSVLRDRFLYDILNSEPLKNTLHNPAHSISSTPLIVSARAMVPDFQKYPHLSPTTRELLEQMKLNCRGVQSGVVHGEVYDNLFKSLKKKRVNYSFDPVLQPIQELREELEGNLPFREEVVSFVETLPHFSHSEDIGLAPLSYSRNLSPETGKMVESQSSDSGFQDSMPPTPNFATFPGVLAPPDNTKQAIEGGLVAIPGIADLNMYPTIAPGSYAAPKTAELLKQQMESLKLGTNKSPQPTSIVQCKACNGDIFAGEVAVKAARAGKEVVWHPQCFRCHECNELLADLVYFFHGGNVYCARDLALSLQIPRCSACDELIFTKEYTAAEGKNFHIKHFCCYHCDAPLAGKQYLPDEKSNMPLCLECYDQFFAARCKRCQRTIAPQEQGVSWGDIHWHGTCFLCVGVGCGKSLIGGRFCVKNELPFCSPQCVKSVIAV